MREPRLHEDGDGAPATAAATTTEPAPWRPHLPDRGTLRDEVLLVLFLSLAMSALYSVVQMIRLPLRGGTVALYSASPLVYQLLGIAQDLIPVLLVVHLLHRSGEAAADIGLDLRRPRRDLLAGAALAALVGGIGLALYAVAVSAGVNRGVVPAPTTGQWWVVPVVLLGAARSAVLEEVIVAGYLLRRLDQMGWGRWPALAVSAVLRASYHLYQGWGGFVGNLAMGVLFGRVYQRWGRVMPLVVAHFLLDAVAGAGWLLVRGHVHWGWLPG